MRNPSSARPQTGTSTQGFTLIELLVVMVIIGVLAVSLTLSVSGRSVEDRMEADARRVQRLLRLASDEALAKGLEFGMRTTTEGYDFLTPDSDSGGWIVIEDGLFRPRQVPEPFVVELRLDGELIKPAPALKMDRKRKLDASSAEANDPVKREDIQPAVLILSSGEMTPFTLDLVLKDNPVSYRVQGNLLGQLTTARLEKES